MRIGAELQRGTVKSLQGLLVELHECSGAVSESVRMNQSWVVLTGSQRELNPIATVALCGLLS